MRLMALLDIDERVAHADIERVPGVGHFLMIEASDDVNRHIETMLEELGGR